MRNQPLDCREDWGHELGPLQIEDTTANCGGEPSEQDISWAQYQLNQP
jgi:hypothetical protein